MTQEDNKPEAQPRAAEGPKNRNDLSALFYSESANAAGASYTAWLESKLLQSWEASAEHPKKAEGLCRWVKAEKEQPEYGSVNSIRYGHENNRRVIDAKYLGLCNDTPRWEENTNSRPRLFSGWDTEWLEELPAEAAEQKESFTEAEMRVAIDHGYMAGISETKLPMDKQLIENILDNITSLKQGKLK